MHFHALLLATVHTETIDKIRARTAEAMTRPEVADRMKAGVENRHQVHSEETRVSESCVSAAAARRVIGWGPWCRVGGPAEGREEV